MIRRWAKTDAVVQPVIDIFGSQCVELSFIPAVLAKADIKLGRPPQPSYSSLAKLFYDYKQSVMELEKETLFVYETHLHDIL